MFNINKKYFILLSLPLVLTACGSDESGRQEAASVAAVASIENNANYQTGAPLEVTADGQTQVIPEGTSLTVLESKEDARLGAMVRVGISSDNSKLPSEGWVRLEELKASKLELLPEGDLEEEDADLSLGSEQLGRKVRAGKRKMTYCYAYVKKYLIKAGLVSTYLPGGSAYQAAGILPKYGFYRIAGGPESAQLNDLCVYRGGRGGNGHIEVRVPGGWYYGYGIKPAPITRVNHPFLGCYRKGGASSAPRLGHI